MDRIEDPRQMEMFAAVKVGDRIRVLKDRANGADAKAGDEMEVSAVFPNGTVFAPVGDKEWALSRGNYEVVRETPQETIQAVKAEIDAANEILAAIESTDVVAMVPVSDPVFRPNHYARYAIEPITFLTANDVGYNAGNVVKYVMRHQFKNGLEDLKKARRYIDIMIEDWERRQRGEPLRMPPV